MNIEDLMSEWAKDSEMDELNIEGEIMRISKLHSKYLSIMTKHKLLVKKYGAEYSKMRLLKLSYYSGDLNNPEDLSKYKLEPWSKKILKTEMPTYLDGDEQLTEILLRKVVNQEMVDACELILKELHSRTFQLKTYVEFRRFTSGN